MKNKFDLSWVKNLYEVGATIRNDAADIMYRAESANLKLREAKLAHKTTMDAISKDMGELEKRIEKLWTQDEIRNAKGLRVMKKFLAKIGTGPSEAVWICKPRGGGVQVLRIGMHVYFKRGKNEPKQSARIWKIGPPPECVVFLELW